MQIYLYVSWNIFNTRRINGIGASIWPTGITVLCDGIARFSNVMNIRIENFRVGTVGKISSRGYVRFSHQCFRDFVVLVQQIVLAHENEIPALSTQIAKFMGPTWGPLGSCRPQEPWYQGSLCSVDPLCQFKYTYHENDLIESDKTTSIYNVSTRVLSKK